MKHAISISDNGILLRPLDEADSEKYRILRNKNEYRKHFFSQEMIAEEQQMRWYREYLEKKNDYMFSVYRQNGQPEFIGCCAVYDVDIHKRRAEYGRLVIDKSKAANKGYGRTATELAKEIAWKELGLKELYLEVYSDNIAAIKVYEGAGFVKKDVKQLNQRCVQFMTVTIGDREN